MMLASLIEQYLERFQTTYAGRVLADHWHAIAAIMRCRTPEAGFALWRCSACGHEVHHPLSCGHRSCPQCQNHTATRWLERQQAKLLPVDYFMVTFTLPAGLRAVAWHHQPLMYNLLFAICTSTLKDFGLNPKHLGGEIGMTALLHTHSRRLDYHPHCHVIVPGGAVDRARRHWKKGKRHYLFNECALAKVFRARFLAAMKAETLPIPYGLPKHWVVDCAHVGKGLPALQYLSRSLYRGVISEQNIVANHDGLVTFKYSDGTTGQTAYRTLPGEDFVWLILQHVLPKGFHRVRDYGFLHGNAKRLLALVQLVVQVVMAARAPQPKPALNCPICHGAMHVIGILKPAWQSG